MDTNFKTTDEVLEISHKNGYYPKFVFNNCSDDDYNQLGEFLEQEEHSYFEVNRDNICLIIFDSNNKIIAFSIICEYSLIEIDSTFYNVGVYVSKKERIKNLKQPLLVLILSTLTHNETMEYVVSNNLNIDGTCVDISNLKLATKLLKNKKFFANEWFYVVYIGNISIPGKNFFPIYIRYYSHATF